MSQSEGLKHFGWGWIVQRGFTCTFSVMAARIVAAGLVHMVVVTGFLTAAREQSPNAQLLFKHLLLSCVLIFHWPKQVQAKSRVSRVAAYSRA